MAETDFAIHTRGTCLTCDNDKCKCFHCKGIDKTCGIGSDEFPMIGSCHYNTIVQCNKRR